MAAGIHGLGHPEPASRHCGRPSRVAGQFFPNHILLRQRLDQGHQTGGELRPSFCAAPSPRTSWYVPSRGRLCHVFTSSITASVTLEINLGETGLPFAYDLGFNAPVAISWCLRFDLGKVAIPLLSGLFPECPLLWPAGSCLS
jgi:hypothetical protein